MWRAIRKALVALVVAIVFVVFLTLCGLGLILFGIGPG